MQYTQQVYGIDNGGNFNEKGKLIMLVNPPPAGQAWPNFSYSTLVHIQSDCDQQRPKQIFCRRQNSFYCRLQNIRVTTLNEGTMKNSSSEIVEMLEWRQMDVCCVQAFRWKGSSVKLLTGKRTVQTLLGGQWRWQDWSRCTVRLRDE